MGRVSFVRIDGETTLTLHRSCREVSEIMTARGHRMSAQAVKQTEERALKKLRRELGEFFRNEWREER